MRKSMKHLVLGSAVASTALFGAAANAEWTANVGAVTNYVWRGVTQTNDKPAVQGGIDYEHKSGFYAGTWLSNVDFADTSSSLPSRGEVELDLYAGYASGETFTWDVGTIAYTYPTTPEGVNVGDTTFMELYFNGGWNILNFGVAYTYKGVKDCDSSGSPFCEGDYYGYVGLEGTVGNDVGLGGTLGYYNFKEVVGDNDSYSYVELYLTKSDFKFAIDVNDLDGEFPAGTEASSPRFWVGYSKGFDL